jgi:hypothetical protein
MVVQLSISTMVGIVAVLVYFPSFPISYSEAVRPETYRSYILFESRLAYRCLDCCGLELPAHRYR